MRFLKILLRTVLALVVLFVAVGFLLPRSARVVRSVTIQAPPTAIYPFLADLKHGWPQWNPFSGEADPGVKVTYSGAEQGVGAQQQWDSRRSGEGHMTIRKADPEHGIEYDAMMMHDAFRLTSSLVCGPASGSAAVTAPKPSAPAATPPAATTVTWTCDIDYGNHIGWRYLALTSETFLGTPMQHGLDTLKKKVEAQVAHAPPVAAEANH